MNQAVRHVVLVHGVWMKPFMMRFLGYRLRKSGFCVHYFGYPSLFRSPIANIESLHQYLGRFERQPLFLVGHSLGGLLVMKCLEMFPDVKVERIALVASPINGSKVASVLSQRAYGWLLLGKSIPMLVSGLQKGHEKVVMFAGSLGLGMGRLFCQLDKPCDGAVSAVETQADWLDEYELIHQNHVGTLFSPTVAHRIVQYFNKARIVEE